MLHSPNATWGRWKSTFVDGFGETALTLPVFNVELMQDWTRPETEASTLTVGLASWTASGGHYVETTCWLLPAIVEYDVVFEDGTVDLPKTAGQGRVLRLVNNTRPITPEKWDVVQKDTIDGVTAQVQILVAANASAAINPLIGPETYWATYVWSLNPECLKHMNWWSNGTKYDTNFTDPTQDVIFTFNKWMLHAATIAAKSWDDIEKDLDPGVVVNQTVSGSQEVTQNIYQSDLRWYAAAATIQLVTVLLILPMFWGFWSIGCDLTMSPFSTALAFDAPILKDVNSAAGAKGVVQELGAVKLRLGVVGAVNDRDGAEGLEVGEAISSGRLGVGKANEVKSLSKGMRFRE